MPLIVKPISAQLVKDKDLFGKSDPYCVISVGNQKQTSRACNGGGKKPSWTDTFSFSSTDQLMRVQVWDKDTFSKDDLIGQGTANLMQFYQNPSRTENEYVDLVYRGGSAGRLLLSIQYQGAPMGGQQGGWGQQQGGWGQQQGGWGQQPQQQGWGGNQGGWGQQPQQGGWGQQQGGWGQQPQQQGWGGNQGGWGGQQNPNQGGWNQGGNQGGWGPNQSGWNNGWR